MPQSASYNRHGRGLTLIELIIVLACLGILTAILLPALAKHGDYAQKLSCENNLKQIGLSFRVWSMDNSNCYPMQVSASNGGTMEIVGAGSTFMHFAVMSNELNTPYLLICPNDPDKLRVRATTFNSCTTIGNPCQPFSGNSNLSYFVAPDADDDHQTGILTGDRQLGLGSAQFAPGLHTVWTKDPLAWVGGPHNGKGNLSMTDGSVVQAANRSLKSLLQSTGTATNRLEIP